jgi:tRNA dimethylallyltransferase
MRAFEPVYIVGPTAVGKSDVAAEVVARMGGEIVSADAFQVYRGLDLLTAKPDAETLARVRHHLVGEIGLEETFDVARFRERAEGVIADIVARGRVPVVVGGTGLYVRALTHGLADLPGADPEVRAELEAQTLEELVAELERLDPVAAGQIDRKNPRRVIRAVEVCRITGQPFSTFRAQVEPLRPVRGVLLTRERAELHARIDRRTERMFDAGVIEEVRAVGAVSATAAQAIGFGEIQVLLRGEIDRAECIARIQQQTRQYAKRQMTWFRRETHFTTLELVGDAPVEETVQRVMEVTSGDR